MGAARTRSARRELGALGGAHARARALLWRSARHLRETPPRAQRRAHPSAALCAKKQKNRAARLRWQGVFFVSHSRILFLPCVSRFPFFPMHPPAFFYSYYFSSAQGMVPLRLLLLLA